MKICRHFYSVFLQGYKVALIFLLIWSFFLESCTSLYFVGNTNDSANLYSNKDTLQSVIVVIPAGAEVLIKQKRKKYSRIIYKGYHGYVHKLRFSNYHRFNSQRDGDLYGYSTKKPKTSRPTSYRSSSVSSTKNKTVHVKGYYRKNGTYVKPHSRKPPTRKR